MIVRIIMIKIEELVMKNMIPIYIFQKNIDIWTVSMQIKLK